MNKVDNFDQLKVKRMKINDVLRAKKKQKKLEKQQFLSKFGVKTRSSSVAIGFNPAEQKKRNLSMPKTHFKGATSFLLQQEASCVIDYMSKNTIREQLGMDRKAKVEK